MSKSHWLWLFMRMCCFHRNTYILYLYNKNMHTHHIIHGHMFYSSLFSVKFVMLVQQLIVHEASLKIIRLTEVLTNLWCDPWRDFFWGKMYKNFIFQNWYFVYVVCWKRGYDLNGRLNFMDEYWMRYRQQTSFGFQVICSMCGSLVVLVHIGSLV